MLAYGEEKEKALCQALSLNLLNPEERQTRLLSGDILEISCNGVIKVVRGQDYLKFDQYSDQDEENQIYYIGCRLDSQMVGIVKLVSALLGVKLVVLNADKRQCRFLVNAKD